MAPAPRSISCLQLAKNVPGHCSTSSAKVKFNIPYQRLPSLHPEHQLFPKLDSRFRDHIMPCFIFKYTSASRPRKLSTYKKICSWIRSFTSSLNSGAMEVASPYAEYPVEGKEHLPYPEYLVEGKEHSPYPEYSVEGKESHLPYPEYLVPEGKEPHLRYQEYFVEGKDRCAEGELFIAVEEVDLASSILGLARHVRSTGLRQVDAQQVDLVFELIGIVQSVAESPLIPSSSATDDMISCLQDPNPTKYADALFLLARDVANPLGAFGSVHPTKYLPFLQQLGGDLVIQ